MKVVDMANEIYVDLLNPSYTSIPAIAFWLRSNVGWLSIELYKSFSVDPTTLEIIDNDTGAEIDLFASAILKQYYFVEDLGGQVRNMLMSGMTDGILSVKDNLAGTSFTRINKAQLAKVMLDYHKEEHEVLNKMVTAYRIGQAVPSQVAGDDTQPGFSQPWPYYRPMWTRMAGARSY